jgi:hypothetical protein
MRALSSCTQSTQAEVFMRAAWFIGALISLLPLLIVGQFNGVTAFGIAVMTVATIRIIKKEGLV